MVAWLKRRGWKRSLIRAAIAMVAFGIVAAAAAGPIQGRILSSRAASSDSGTRRKALDHIARERVFRALPAVKRAVAQETDPEILASGVYALLRVGTRHEVDFLKSHVRACEDGETRARMILYAARLSHRDLRLTDWLDAAASSDDPWTRAGAAVGLLELGDPAGGTCALSLARATDAHLTTFLTTEFRRIADPLLVAAGQRYTWPADTTPRDFDLEQLSRLWTRYANHRSLNDVLDRLERSDDMWHQVNRLLHARERVARWLQ